MGPAWGNSSGGGDQARPGLCRLPGKSTHLVLQALSFIIFICFTASVSAYMAAALLELLITLAFLFLYATQCHQRFDRLNWPCLVRGPPPHPVLFPLQPLSSSQVPRPGSLAPSWALRSETALTGTDSQLLGP